MTDDGPMNRIVVGVDGSDESRNALGWALDEARLRNAAIEVVHVWQPPYVGAFPFAMPPFDSAELDREAHALAEQMVGAADTSGLAAPVAITVMCGSAASVLLERAEDAAMVVVGARGRGGFSRLLLGSVSSQLVHHATSAVVVIR